MTSIKCKTHESVLSYVCVFKDLVLCTDVKKFENLKQNISLTVCFLTAEMPLGNLADSGLRICTANAANSKIIFLSMVPAMVSLQSSLLSYSFLDSSFQYRRRFVIKWQVKITLMKNLLVFSRIMFSRNQQSLGEEPPRIKNESVKSTCSRYFQVCFDIIIHLLLPSVFGVSNAD